MYGTNILVAGIDNDFIEDFVKTWIEHKLPPHHLGRARIIDPARLLVGLGAADIGVREFQDVLVVGVLLILTNVGHGLEYGGYGFLYAASRCQFLICEYCRWIIEEWQTYLRPFNFLREVQIQIQIQTNFLHREVHFQIKRMYNHYPYKRSMA